MTKRQAKQQAIKQSLLKRHERLAKRNLAKVLKFQAQYEKIQEKQRLKKNIKP